MIDAKKLKVGDKVRRINVGSSYFQFIEGKEYEVHSSHGELYVYDEVGTRYDLEHLKANSSLWEHVEEHKFIGLVFINDIALECNYGKQEYTVEVTTDREGLKSLRALEAESSEALRKERLIHDIKATEDKLASMKAELNKI